MSAHQRLLEDAASGDDDALARLVRAYHDRVYRFGLRACRDAFDADDAVQEAFVTLARRPDVQNDTSVLSWLLSTVRNACLRLLRPFIRERRLGERVADMEEVAADDLSPESALERFRLVERVHRSLAALPRVYREVLVLRDLEGLSGEETARALGISLAAVKSRLHRARAMLREDLTAQEESS